MTADHKPQTNELSMTLKDVISSLEPSASKANIACIDDAMPPEVLDICASTNFTGIPVNYGVCIPEGIDAQDVARFLHEQDSLSFDEYAKMMAYSSGDGEPPIKHSSLASYKIVKKHTDLLNSLVVRKSAHTLSTFAGFIAKARDISGMRVITEETATLSLGFSGLRFSPVDVDHGEANYEVMLKEAHQSVYLIIKPSRQLSSDLKDLVALYLKQLTAVDSIKEMRIALYTCLAMLGCMMDDTDADEIVYQLVRKHRVTESNPTGELSPAKLRGSTINDRAILLRLCRSLGGQNHSKADVIEDEFSDDIT